MAKYKIIPLDLFKRSIIVFIGSHKEFKRWIPYYFGDDKEYDSLIELVEENNYNDVQASFWYNGTTGEGIIELPKMPRTPKEIAYTAHEALHATFHTLDYCGIEYIKNGSNETFTYLLELIISNLLEIENYKIINYDS